MPSISLSTFQIALMRVLVACGARFLVIGGKAANYHGCTRRSEDLDLVYNNEPHNIERAKVALVRLGLRLPQNLGVIQAVHKFDLLGVDMMAPRGKGLQG
jgi:hypothetical protein